jgi:hypothetical protein
MAEQTGFIDRLRRVFARQSVVLTPPPLTDQQILQAKHEIANGRLRKDRINWEQHPLADSILVKHYPLVSTPTLLAMLSPLFPDRLLTVNQIIGRAHRHGLCKRKPGDESK